MNLVWIVRHVNSFCWDTFLLVTVSLRSTVRPRKRFRIWGGPGWIRTQQVIVAHSMLSGYALVAATAAIACKRPQTAVSARHKIDGTRIFFFRGLSAGTPPVAVTPGHFCGCGLYGRTSLPSGIL